MVIFDWRSWKIIEFELSQRSQKQSCSTQPFSNPFLIIPLVSSPHVSNRLTIQSSIQIHLPIFVNRRPSALPVTLESPTHVCAF